MIWFSASRFVGWVASAHQRARETDDVGTGCPPYLTEFVFSKSARLIDALKKRGVSEEVIAEAERDAA